MGYSLSQEQWEKLESHRHEGRQCAMSTGRGGCFSRATYKVTSNSWVYESNKLSGDAPPVHTMVFCTKHTEPVGYEGGNFTVTAVEKIDATIARELREEQDRRAAESRARFAARAV